MSKQGVLWGLGGILGVALATLCLLLVTVMGTGAQNSAQGSVEPQVTTLPTGESSNPAIARTPGLEPKVINLPTGESSNLAIARTPGVEPGLPLVPSLFQPSDPSPVSLTVDKSEFDEPASTANRNFNHRSQLTVNGLVGIQVIDLAARPVPTINDGDGDGGTAADVIFLFAVPGNVLEKTTTITLTLDGSALSQPGLFAFAVADDVVEFDETVNVYIATVDGVPIEDSGVDITIRANDRAQATLTVEDGNGTEGDTRMATIDLGGKTLSSAIPTGTLRLVLADGSTMNEDVEIVATDIVAGLQEESTVKVPIRLKDDDLVEGDERVDLELLIDSTIAPVLKNSERETDSFTLTDADSKGVRIAALSKTAYNEGENVTVTVELLPGVMAGADITVNYELIVDTTGEVGKASAADIDGGLITGTVTINEGAGTASITINLEDDDVAEATERLDVRLTSASGAPGVTADARTTQLTILDNEPTEYTLEGAATVVESVTYTVRLSRIGTITADATVDYKVSGGDSSPVREADFAGNAFPRGSFTFNGYDALSDEVSILIENDGFSEETETFQISVNGGSLTTNKEVAIIDDDPLGMPEPVVIGFRPEVYEVDEGAGSVTLTVEVINGMLTEEVTLSYRISGSTATAGEDYTSKNSMLTLSAGDTSATIVVDITDDALFENAETFGVVLSGAPPGVVLTSGPAEVTITDTNAPDVVEIGFDPDTYTVDEGSGTVRLTVKVLSGDLGRDVTLSYETMDGSAIAGEDYMSKDSMLTLSAGDAETTIVVNITDDALFENTEMFTVVLSGAPAGVTLTSGPAEVTITDTNAPDVVVIGFDSNTYTVDEGSGTIALTVKVLSGGLGRDVTVSYDTSDGSAIAGEDYTSKNSMLTLSAADTEATIMVPITDDMDSESPERFFVDLQPLSSLPDEVTLDQLNATVTIIDNDGAVIGFRPEVYEVDEDAGSVILTVEVISGELIEDVTLIYTTADGSAVAGEDYTSKLDMLTLSAGDTSATIVVDITDDSTEEPDEMFTVELSPGSSGVTLDSSVATVTINENDQPPVVIGFRSEEYEVEEGAGSVILTVEVISGVLTEEVTLSYTTADGIATSPGDYTGTGANGVSIPALSAMTRSVTFRVEIVDDMDPESAESFFVDLELLPLPDRVTLNPSFATVTIPENDQPIVGFDSATYRVAENAGTVVLTVKLLSGILTAPVTVSYETMDGSARTGSDYTTMMSTLTLSPGDTEETIMVPIIDDSTEEPDEMFTVELSGAPAGITLDPSVATVTIDENDQPPVVIGFDSGTYRVNENAGTLDLTVSVISGVLTETIRLNYLVSDVSTTASDDYTVTVNVLELSLMNTSATISVDIINDTLLEFEEKFTVELSGAPAGITLAPASATVAIVDTEVTLSDPHEYEDFAVRETSDSNLRGSFLEFELTNAPGGAPVPLVLGLAARAARSNDGGTAADVYFVEFGAMGPVEITSVTIDAGQTSPSGFFGFVTVDDDVVELTETVNLYIATVNGISITDDGLDLTIFGNDRVRARILTVEDGREGDTITATINLGGKTLSDAIPPGALRLVLADGSTMNADVEIGATDIVAGLRESSTVNVPIRLKDDDLVEGLETVDVELRIDSPGLEDLLNVGRTGSFMLADADSGEVSIAALSKTTYNEGEDVTVTVELPSGLTAVTDITVGYELIVTTTDEVGKASAADITGPTSGFVTIDEGAGTAIITINLKDDDVVEATEQLGVRLTSLSGVPAGITLDPATATVTIVDNDETPVPEIGFEFGTYRVNEDAGTLDIMVSVINGVLTETIRLNYVVSDVSTTVSDDYTVTVDVLELPLMTHGGTISIDIIDDTSPESEEKFTVQLSGAPVGVSLNKTRATVTIIDNDQPAVGFRSANYEANEGAGGVTVTFGIYNNIVLPPGVSLTVEYATRDGSAKLADGDYSIKAGTVTFSAGMTETTIYVDITDDSEFEADETFLVRLIRVEANILSPQPQTTVTLNNNDLPEVTLSDPHGDLAVRETSDSNLRGSFLEFELTNAPGGAPVPLVLGLAARAARSNDGGTAADVYFVEFGAMGPLEITSVTIDAGQTSPSGFFGFVTVDDDVVELTETVNLYIATVNGISITDDGLDLTIFGNDRVRARILTVEDGREGDTITATIDLGGKTLSDAIPPGALRLVLADGSTMNADVEIGATDVVLGLQKTAAVNVPIRLKDDDLFEGPETVDLELRIDSTIAPGLEDLLNVGRTGSFMLADTDSGEVSIAALSKTTYNEGEDVTVTVELPNGLTAATDITVGYELIVTTTDEVGKASAADIIGLTSGFVTINEGAGTAIITISLANDDVVEVTEQLGVRLTSARGVPGVTVDTTITRLTIIGKDEPTVPPVVDPDTVVIGFRSATYEVDEGAGSVTLTVEVISGVLTEEVTLTHMTAAGSATSPGDYTSANGVSIPALSAMTQSVTLRVAIIDDDEIDPDEMFTVELSGAPVGVSFNPTRATVTIIDNDETTVPPVGNPDPVEIGFDPVMYTVDEGAGTVILTVKVLDGSLDREVILNYRTDDVTATAGEDYTSKDSMLTLSAGDTEATIEVDITEDDLLENAEMFTVVLSGAPAGVTLTPDTAEVTITDTNAPDAVEIGFDPVMYTVDEGAGTVRLTVKVLDGSLGRDVILNYRTDDGTATAGEDYTSKDSMLTLTPGNPEATIEVDITEDDLLENAEMFTVVLSGAPAGVTLTPDTAEVTITDTNAPDAVEIGFDPVMYTVDEDAGTIALTVKVLSGDLGRAVTLSYETRDGTATAGEDYTSKATTLTLSAGDTETTIVVNITDDDLFENAEMLTVVLSGAPAGVTLTPDTAEITISDDRVAPPPDDDMVEIGFDPVMYTVDEGAGTIALTVKVLSGDLGRAVTLSYETRDGTATAGEDYTSKATTLTLSAGDTETTIVVNITDDDLFENEEMFTVVLSGAPAGVTLTPDTAEVTITDTKAPDLVEIGFDPVMYTVDEGSGTIALTVKVLSGDLGRDVTVSYETMDGSAIAGEDYTRTIDTIMLSDTIRNATFTVPIIDDGLFENDELFTVVLSGAPAGITLDPATATVTITDDDGMPTVTVTPASPTVAEGEDALFTVTLTGEAEADIVVTLTATPGSGLAAAEDGDFSATPVSVTFSTGEVSRTLRLPTTEDEVYEDNEEVALSFSISGPAIEGSVPSTLTIENDDGMPTVTVTPASPTVAEGEEALFTVTLTGEAEADIVVTLTATPGSGSAAAEDGDFSPTPVSVTFSTGEDSRTLRLPTTEDEVYEDNEEVALSFSISGPASEGSVPSTLTIENDDTIIIGFDPEMYTVDEGSGTVTLTVKVLSGDLGRDVTLNYETMDGSTVAGEDYTTVQSTLTLTPVNTETIIVVNITDDGLFENDELFTVVLREAPAGVTLNPASAEVTITDNEPAPDGEIGFDSGTYRVNEASGTVELTVSVISGVLADTVTLTYATVGGSATSGADYELSTGTVELSPRMRTATIEIVMLDDSVVESAEIFFVDLERVSVPNSVSLIQFRAAVTIIDNDVVEIGFDPVMYTVNEGAGTIELTVKVLSGGLGRDVTLNYRTDDDTATAGEDYMSKDSMLTLSAGDTSATIVVEITDDALFENAEIFTVVLSGAPAGVTLIPSTATITITDTNTPDVVEIGFDPDTYTVDEGSGTITLTVKVLSGDLGRDVTVSYETMDGSAIAGEDYTTVQSTLTLTPGNPEMTIVVNITDDALFESAETFTVVLSGAPAGVTLTPATATITITDTNTPDVVEIGFDPEMYTVNEGAGTIELTVKVLSGDLGRDVTLSYETMDGSAIAGEDYTTVRSTLTLTPVNPETTIVVNITDDALFENAEIFTVVLSGAPAGVTLTPDTAEITISDDRVAPPPDDDMVEIGFDPVMYTVDEGAGTIALTVKVLSGDLGRDVTLSYETMDGSAIAGEDYTSKDSVLTLSAGDTSATIVVNITDDDLFENAEMFTVVLSGAPAGVTLTPDTAEVTITDTNAPDVVEIGFDPVMYTVDERAGTIALTVKVLSGDLGRAVTLSYETMDGSAIAGEDYTSKDSVLTLSAGDTETTIVVNITDDDLFENEEMFTVVLSGAPAGVTLTPDTAEVTITDTNAPDVVEIGFDPVMYTVDEGSGTVALTVKVLSGDLGRDVTVSYETMDGSAIAGEDYTTVQSTLTLSAGDTSATIVVNITDDDLFENAETFTVVLSGAPAGVTLTPGTATVTITDTNAPDVVEIGFDPVIYTVDEESGTVRLTVKVLSGDLGGDVTVSYETMDGSATAGEDYTTVQSTLTLSAGDTSATIVVNITDDALFENAEMFTVVLSGAPAGVMLTSGTATVTIENDDGMPTVTVTPASPTVAEGETATFTVTLTGEAEADIVVTLTATPGSGLAAAEDGDFSATPVSVTFSAGEVSGTLRLPTTEDEVYEDNEEVALSFSISGPAIEGSVPSTLTITNDDSMPTVTITPAPPSVAEGDEAAFTVMLTGEAEADIEVTLTATPGSGLAAAEVGDFSATPVSVTFSTGEDSKTLRLPTTEDEVHEDNEEVALSFSISGPATIASAPSTLTIMNDDGMPTVTVTPASPTVAEGEEALFTVTLTGKAEADIEVTLTATPGSGSAAAAAEDGDFSATPVSVTFSTGEDSKTLRLPTTEDDVYEDNEEVALSFRISGPASEGSVPSILTIEDDDTVIIGFEPVIYTVDEDSGTVALTVKVLNGDLGRDVTLSYETMDGSAVAGEDYTSKLDMLTLSAGDTSATIVVDITDDALYENAELFTVVLSGAPSRVTLNPASAEVTITDDEPAPAAVIGFEQIEYLVSEEVSRTVLTVSVISGVLPDTATLTYATVDGSATSGADYELSTGTVTLSPRMRTATIEVSVLDDSVVESVEMFFVDLRRASVTNTVLLTPFRASVTIEDNEVAIGFDSRTYRVGEASGTVELTVSVINGVLTETITLNYKTMDGSAIAGEDYTSTMSTVTLSPMTPSVTFTVPIIDDTSLESEEEFTVVLSGAPADITLDPATATVTIIDNDAVVIGFDKATYSVNEGDVTVEFTVSVINGVLMETITLSYKTMNGIAIAGEDYVLTTGTLTLTPMTPSVTFTVDIMEDTSQEPAEEFTVVLSDAPAAITLDPAIATVTIPENDQPTGGGGPGPGPGPGSGSRSRSRSRSRRWRR